MSSLHITVMLGGPSAEREVSLRSGTAVSNALRSLGHTVSELDPRAPGWKLPAGTDVVFLALHGTYGEDGTVQKELDRLGVPYTGCDAESSRLAFDKHLSKQKFTAAQVPTARFMVFRSPNASWPSGWRTPVVLKPVRQGSSVGVEFVDDEKDFGLALNRSFRHDTEVLMEERVFGRETTVGIMGDEPLPVVEVRPKSGVYDYRSKYTSGQTEYLCPAPFSPEATRTLQQAGLEAFRALGCRDYARVDIILMEDGSPIVLEVNTLPGMTETSLLPKAAAAAGMTYAELCQRMVDLALDRSGTSKF